MAGLADRFGGATAYTREPAEGLWKRATTMEHDRIIVVEVMVEDVEEAWWHDYRQRLEREFEQESVIIRVTAPVGRSSSAAAVKNPFGFQ